MLQSVSVRAMSHRAYCKRNINTTSLSALYVCYYTCAMPCHTNTPCNIQRKRVGRIFLGTLCWCGISGEKNLTYIGLDEPYILNFHTVSLCLFSDDFISSQTYCICYLVDSVCLVSIWIGNIYATTNVLCGSLLVHTMWMDLNGIEFGVLFFHSRIILVYYFWVEERSGAVV